jgi:serine/threonine protein kinase
MIVFSCSRCSKELRVEDELAGLTSRCTSCGQTLPVPLYPVASPVPTSDAAQDLSPPLFQAGGPGGSTPLPGPLRAGVDREAATLPPGRSYGAGTGAAVVGARQALHAAGVRPELYDFLAPPQEPGELGRLGQYRIFRVLGSGGMGVVFQAEDTILKRQVALKAMLPTLAVSESARQRFLREAVSAAQVDHDHIVHIYQVGEERGVPFLAMQLLKGEPLDARLERESRLPVPEILRIGREIAEGLAAAHDQGLIHRDIKPANIWLESRGQETGIRNQGGGSSAAKSRVKILDFGLARALAGTVQLTQMGAIVGTPAYMAPEQAGKAVDHRCDLFSLGCVLYRMSTGQAAFSGLDTISTLLAVATDVPRTPGELNPDLPPALSDLIMRLLAKKPEDRPPSARAVIEAIQAIEAEESGLSFSPKKFMAGITARIPRTKWLNAVSGWRARRQQSAISAPPPARPLEPVSPPVPPPEPPPVARLPLRFRQIGPVPQFVPRRRRRWLRLVVIIAIVFFVVRILVGILPGPIVFETDDPSDAFTIQVGDKVLVEKRARGPLKEARESAEKYLSEQFDSSMITYSHLTDPNHALFRGTGTKGSEKKKHFRLEVSRKQADAPWEAVRLE